MEDPIVKAQLELLKRGKINKRRLIVRLKDNPTDKAAGPSGFFDPFPDETPGGMARTNEVVVLSSEGPSSMTTTRMYSGPGFRAQSSITVKTRAFKEVERVRKKGKDNMEGFLDKKNFTDMKHYWYGARSGVSVLEVEDESMLEELWAKLSEDGGEHTNEGRHWRRATYMQQACQLCFPLVGANGMHLKHSRALLE